MNGAMAVENALPVFYDQKDGKNLRDTMNSNKIYSIKEIFLTLQGEGHNAGKTAVFCRFAGCNLWNGNEKDRKKAICSFCDTDFKGIDGLRYELKSSYKIYQPRVSHTAWITMKNFRGHSTGISQTFDKLIAIDKTYNAVLLCDFDNLEMEETGAVVRCRLHNGLYNTIAQCKPKSKNIDVKKELNNLIESLI